MAQHLSAERQARKAITHRLRNRAFLSKMKTLVKKVRSEKDKEKAAAELRKAVKFLDQLAAKGIIHRNNAANQKSGLSKYVKSIK